MRKGRERKTGVTGWRPLAWMKRGGVRGRERDSQGEGELKHTKTFRIINFIILLDLVTLVCGADRAAP